LLTTSTSRRQTLVLLHIETPSILGGVYKSVVIVLFTKEAIIRWTIHFLANNTSDFSILTLNLTSSTKEEFAEFAVRSPVDPLDKYLVIRANATAIYLDFESGSQLQTSPFVHLSDCLLHISIKMPEATSRSLYVPDLFAGVLSGEPVENPHESIVAPQSEAWTKESVKHVFCQSRDD
jgi:hypothetical protein